MKPISPAPKRKGARRRSEVPAGIVAGLNGGTLEAVTLVEMLVLDHGKLLAAVAPEVSPAAVRAHAEARAKSIVGGMKSGGETLFAAYGKNAFARFAGHRSDTVRAWAAYALAARPDLSLAEKLDLIRPLADDPNPGVREWAWIALRPAVSAELDAVIRILIPWTKEPSENLRRYAIEITRPRGVWCAHIPALKADPTPGFALLKPVFADPALYVRKSVGNWLNDAGKTRPDAVDKFLAHRRPQPDSKHTAWIIRHALRSRLP